MHSSSRKSGDPKDFEAFKLQRNKVTAMLRAAKMEYIGLHEEEVSAEGSGARPGEGGMLREILCRWAAVAANTPLLDAVGRRVSPWSNYYHV